MFRLFHKEKKELNVIDFGSGNWGHNIVLDTKNTDGKMINKAHGWYSRNLILSESENKFNLKKDSLVVKDAKGGHWIARVKDIEWAENPNDMFFCTVQTITDEKQLTKEELSYIEKVYNK